MKVTTKLSETVQMRPDVVYMVRQMHELLPLLDEAKKWTNEMVKDAQNYPVLDQTVEEFSADLKVLLSTLKGYIGSARMEVE